MKEPGASFAWADNPTRRENRQMTNITGYTAALAAGFLLLTGCNRAESPREVAGDVAEAQQEGTEEVAEAQADAAEDRQDTGYVMNESAAENEYEIKVAQAEADHKVAIESCEILEGDAQQTCKNDADAQLAASKAEAERLRPPGS
jgi:hypothetical protein